LEFSTKVDTKQLGEKATKEPKKLCGTSVRKTPQPCVGGSEKKSGSKKGHKKTRTLKPDIQFFESCRDASKKYNKGA